MFHLLLTGWVWIRHFRQVISILVPINWIPDNLLGFNFLRFWSRFFSHGCVAGSSFNLSLVSSSNTLKEALRILFVALIIMSILNFNLVYNQTFLVQTYHHAIWCWSSRLSTVSTLCTAKHFSYRHPTTPCRVGIKSIHRLYLVYCQTFLIQTFHHTMWRWSSCLSTISSRVPPNISETDVPPCNDAKISSTISLGFPHLFPYSSSGFPFSWRA